MTLKNFNYFPVNHLNSSAKPHTSLNKEIRGRLDMLFFRPVTPESENTNHGILKYSQFSFQIAKKKCFPIRFIIFSSVTLSCWNLLGLTPSTTFSGRKGPWDTKFTGDCANVTKQQRIVGWKVKWRKGKVYLEDIYQKNLGCVWTFLGVNWLLEDWSLMEIWQNGKRTQSIRLWDSVYYTQCTNAVLFQCSNYANIHFICIIYFIPSYTPIDT